jgi:hypothetical protein
MIDLLTTLCNQKSGSKDYTHGECEMYRKGELVAFHVPEKKLYIVQDADRIKKVYSVHEAAELTLKNESK